MNCRCGWIIWHDDLASFACGRCGATIEVRDRDPNEALAHIRAILRVHAGCLP